MLTNRTFSAGVLVQPENCSWVGYSGYWESCLETSCRKQNLVVTEVLEVRKSNHFRRLKNSTILNISKGTAGCRESDDHDKVKHTNAAVICICTGPNIFLFTEVSSLIPRIMWTC